MRSYVLTNLYKTLVIHRLFCTVTSTQTMRAAQLKAPGGPENLFVGDNIPVPELPSDNHVLIKVVATALNRADTLQRKGSYNPPPGESDILGLEASGYIESVGKNVTNFKAGDRVMALLGGGGYAEYTTAHCSSVMEVPSPIDLVTAAAIPEVWLTAYQLLHFVAKIQPGESVLIHAVGSGVGTAATQLVKAIPNTQVIGTAGSQEKLDLAKSLGADVLINYKQENFEKVVKEATKGKGVNIILDPVGASYWEKNVNSLSVDGRWILYGLMGGAKIDGPLFGKLLMKRIQLLASTLRARSLDYKGELVSAFHSNCISHFESQKFKPIVDCVLSLDDVAEAHQRMDNNINKGKIVLKVRNVEDQKEEL